MVTLEEIMKELDKDLGECEEGLKQARKLINFMKNSGKPTGPSEREFKKAEKELALMKKAREIMEKEE